MSNLTTISTKIQEDEFKNATKIGKVLITKAIGVSSFNSTFMCDKSNFILVIDFTIFVID